MNADITLFRVVRDEDRTRVETEQSVLGWGVQFRSGHCYIDWNRNAYSEEDRLDHPHVSGYGSFDDVEQGTGGTIECIAKFPAREEK